MSFVNLSPELVASAAQNVAGIGSALDQAHVVAAPATTSVVAAAEDEVSAAIAAVFSGHGQAFQAASAQAAQFHAGFVQTLGGAGGAYAAAEAAGAGLVNTYPALPFPSPMSGAVIPQPITGAGTVTPQDLGVLSGNVGTGHIGVGNTGSYNTGFCNSGTGHVGFFNTGSDHDMGIGLAAADEVGVGPVHWSTKTASSMLGLAA